MEKLEIVHEETNTPMGLYLPRADAIKQGAWCRSTNVFVLNHKGEVLCHQRSLEKERMPGMWCTHLGGHVSSEETYESNALKEIEEEAGIKLDPKQLIHWRTTKADVTKLWIREFVTLYNVDVKTLTPQPGEVEAFAWKSLKSILEDVKKNPEAWCAGTHDFFIEYHCLRAAIVAADAMGMVQAPKELIHWR